MLFSLLQMSWAIKIQKMKWFWALILLSALSPNMGRFVQDFFFTSSIGTSGRYVQQIDRAITTYNFCNFNILGIFHFQFISSIVLLHILSQSRLILIEYKNEWNILITSGLSCTSDRCTFWQILENQLSQ